MGQLLEISKWGWHHMQCDKRRISPMYQWCILDAIEWRGKETIGIVMPTPLTHLSLHIIFVVEYKSFITITYRSNRIWMPYGTFIGNPKQHWDLKNTNPYPERKTQLQWRKNNKFQEATLYFKRFFCWISIMILCSICGIFDRIPAFLRYFSSDPACLTVFLSGSRVFVKIFIRN